MQERFGLDADVFRTALGDGANWMAGAWSQPAGTLMQHHGLPIRLTPSITATFYPTGIDGRDGQILVTARKVNQGYRNWFMPPTVDAEEVDVIVETIESAGLKIEETKVETLPAMNQGWQIRTTISDGIADEMKRIVETYHKGCPTHGTVFCSHERNRCDWFAEGRKLVNEPLKPEVVAIPKGGVLPGQFNFAEHGNELIEFVRANMRYSDRELGGNDFLEWVDGGQVVNVEGKYIDGLNQIGVPEWLEQIVRKPETNSARLARIERLAPAGTL